MGTVEPCETSSGKRYRIHYRKPDRSQTDKRGFTTKQSAAEYLATVEVSKLRGEWMDPTRPKVTVGEWASPWYLAHSELKPTTLLGYDQALKNHVLPRWGRLGFRMFPPATSKPGRPRCLHRMAAPR